MTQKKKNNRNQIGGLLIIVQYITENIYQYYIREEHMNTQIIKYILYRQLHKIAYNIHYRYTHTDSSLVHVEAA